MSKLYRRCCLAFSMIAAALALLAVSSAGALAADGEPSNSSAPGEAIVEPQGNSTQPAAPASSSPDSTEWAPQGAGKGTSSGEAAPLQHGSSVGSGGVTGKAGSNSEEAPSGSNSERPSYAPESSGIDEPEPSTQSTFDESASTPRAESGNQPVQPAVTEKPARTGGAVNVAVGTAIPLGHTESPQVGSIGSVSPAAVAPFADSGDQAEGGYYALPLLAVIVLGLILGFAFVRLRRRRQRQRLEALWRRQDAVWEAALRRADLGQAPAVSTPSAKQLQRISVG